MTRFNYSYLTSICSDLIRRKLGLWGSHDPIHTHVVRSSWMWGRVHYRKSVVPRSIPVSVLWVEVKVSFLPAGVAGPRRHSDGVGTPASRTGTALARPRAPRPAPSLLSQRPPRQEVQQPPPHTRGEPPSHSPPSYSIAITPEKMPEERGSDSGWPGNARRTAPLRPFADALNAPHPGPTGSYLAAASWSTRPAGSSPGGAWAPPRRAPRAQGKTVQPARTARTGEEAAAWRERARRE